MTALIDLRAVIGSDRRGAPVLTNDAFYPRSSPLRRTALITGATSGIGAVFARRLAEQGYALVLTGRREAELAAVAERLEQAHRVPVRVTLAELADRRGQDAVAAAIAETPDLELLVNNAGFGYRNRFHEGELERHLAMLEVHCAAVVRLTHAALPGMIARGRGAIVNVSSVASFIPYPRNVIYGATKAFVTSFSEGLALELDGTGVRVQALCPGMTRTDFHSRLGQDPARVYRDRGFRRAMSPEDVVDASLAALARDQVVCVPGGNNVLATIFATKLPRTVVRRVIARMLGTGKPRSE